MFWSFSDDDEGFVCLPLAHSLSADDEWCATADGRGTDRAMSHVTYIGAVGGASTGRERERERKEKKSSDGRGDDDMYCIVCDSHAH